MNIPFTASKLSGCSFTYYIFKFLAISRESLLVASRYSMSDIEPFDGTIPRSYMVAHALLTCYSCASLPFQIPWELIQSQNFRFIIVACTFARLVLRGRVSI